ncbi:MAG: hypothetical protein GXX96_06645 [Planctomycetaceae bacterium]|nr:hypothetical protein [Planctomycetaceae bacterium]
MIPLRRLWAQITGHLLEEVVGIHQRAHATFGHKLGRTHAFPLFQGKRRNRTIIYNAEYDSAGELRRGVLFITTGAFVQPSASEQWSIGHRWRYWKPTARQLQRLAYRVFDAVGDEWNLDLAPLKMPIKLSDWINDLALEFAQRSRLDPDHPQLAKCLRLIFVRGGHDTAVGQHFELPHEGLGGLLAAFVLAACRHRVDSRWEQAFAMPDVPVGLWSKAPPLWTELTPGAERGVALGYPRPGHASSDSPGGIQLARYPRADMAASAENALRAAANVPSPSLYEVAASFPAAAKAGDLASWSEILHAISRSGEEDAKVWNLTQPDVLESVRQSIKEWDRSFSKWVKETARSS